MKAWHEGDGFQLQWPYELKAVRSFRIVRKFNEHARCSFTAAMSEDHAEACIRNGSFQDSLMIRKRGEERDQYWFSGGISNIDIRMEDGIPCVEVEAVSRTHAMDVKPVSRSFQNKQLTYTKVIQELVEGYPGGDAQNAATKSDAVIGELIIQYRETDWQFMKRLASRLGTVILPDVSMDAARIYFGVPDLVWGTEIQSQRYSLIKDRNSYLDFMAHAEGDHAESIHEADFVSYRVITDTYCQVGDDVRFKGQIWVVSESVISYEEGILQYSYVLVKREALRRKSRLNYGIQGVALEGRVVKRANNMVKVHLDIDEMHDEQGNWWFPYSPEGNNIFHCLPDEGARIKIYFPSGVEKKAIAVNSVRGGSEEMKSRTVFQKPATKVFHMPGKAKMELGDDGVLFEKGTVSLHLDGSNITVKADEDLLVVAGNNIDLNSNDSESVLESIKMKATDFIAFQTNEQQYIVIDQDQVGIKGSKIHFKKVEVEFIDLLTDEELKVMYIDQAVEGEKLLKELQLSASARSYVPLPESEKRNIRTGIEERLASDPRSKEKIRDAMKSRKEEDLKRDYQKKYASNARAPEEKTKEQKAEEKSQYVKSYEEYTKMKYNQYHKSAENVQNVGGGNLPATKPATITESTDPSPLEKMLGAFLEAVELNVLIPRKPDYLSKKSDEAIFYSRYTFQTLIIDPQMLMSQFNIMFGVIAIATAIPTGGSSLYLLAAAEGFLGVAEIVINVKKLNDLEAGDASSSPTFAGLNQSMVDGLGIGLAVVNLAILMKHGVVKIADMATDSRKIAALDDGLRNWRRIEGTGNDAKIPRTGPEWDEYFRTKYGDKNVDWKTSSEYKLYGDKYIPYTPKIRPNAVITKPSLPKGGKPEGNYAPIKGKDKDTRGLERQNEAADVLSENGYRTTMLDETPNGNVFEGNGYGIHPDKSPDFIIEGQVFDCYAPNSPKLSTILKKLREKTTDQARRIVLNLNDYPIEKRAELIEFIISQTHKELKHLDELLVIEGRQVTRAYWRYE